MFSNGQNKEDKGSFTPDNVVEQYQYRFMQNNVDRSRFTQDIVLGIAARENNNIIIPNEPKNEWCNPKDGMQTTELMRQ